MHSLSLICRLTLGLVAASLALSACGSSGSNADAKIRLPKGVSAPSGFTPSAGGVGTVKISSCSPKPGRQRVTFLVRNSADKPRVFLGSVEFYAASKRQGHAATAARKQIARFSKLSAVTQPGASASWAVVMTAPVGATGCNAQVLPGTSQ